MLNPASRTGVRVVVRGVVDIQQFHVLLADAAHAALGCPRPPSRFVAAYRGVEQVIPAGVPMVAEGHFQMFKHTAAQPDGSVPKGFRGSDHWLWANQPLADIPKFENERIVLLGEPAFRLAWEVERRFPRLAANVRLVQVLSAGAVAENLSRLTGNHIPAQAPASRPLAA